MPKYDPPFEAAVEHLFVPIADEDPRCFVCSATPARLVGAVVEGIWPLCSTHMAQLRVAAELLGEDAPGLALVD